MNNQEFSRSIEQAKQASFQSPVIVTEQGLPKHVLLSFEEFEKITHLLKLRYDTIEMGITSESEDIQSTKNNPTVAELLSVEEADPSLFDSLIPKASITLKPEEFD